MSIPSSSAGCFNLLGGLMAHAEGDLLRYHIIPRLASRDMINLARTCRSLGKFARDNGGRCIRDTRSAGDKHFECSFERHNDNPPPGDSRVTRCDSVYSVTGPADPADLRRFIDTQPFSHIGFSVKRPLLWGLEGSANTLHNHTEDLRMVHSLTLEGWDSYCVGWCAPWLLSTPPLCAIRTVSLLNCTLDSLSPLSGVHRLEIKHCTNAYELGTTRGSLCVTELVIVNSFVWGVNLSGVTGCEVLVARGLNGNLDMGTMSLDKLHTLHFHMTYLNPGIIERCSSLKSLTLVTPAYSGDFHAFPVRTLAPPPSVTFLRVGNNHGLTTLRCPRGLDTLVVHSGLDTLESIAIPRAIKRVLVADMYVCLPLITPIDLGALPPLLRAAVSRLSPETDTRYIAYYSTDRPIDDYFEHPSDYLEQSL